MQRAPGAYRVTSRETWTGLRIPCNPAEAAVASAKTSVRQARSGGSHLAVRHSCGVRAGDEEEAPGTGRANDDVVVNGEEGATG